MKITFHNQPKLSEHEVQKEMNVLRMSLVDNLPDFLGQHEFFVDKEVGVTFAETGVSSLVVILETENRKMVLKIPLNKNSSNAEGLFLKTWEQVGVRVPHVVDEGMIDGSPYIIYNYIEAEKLSEVYDFDQCIEQGIFLEMGQTLRQMHELVGEGYGRVKEGRGEYSTFEDWLSNSDMKKRIDYTVENNLLTPDCGSLEQAIEILSEFINQNPKVSYCHDDFGGGNIFATKPITVFDPNPSFNHGLIDLGKSLVNHLAFHGRLPEQIVEGYFSGEDYDKRVLHASIILNSVDKFFNMHRTGRFEMMENTKRYLVENKHLLE